MNIGIPHSPRLESEVNPMRIDTEQKSLALSPQDGEKELLAKEYIEKIGYDPFEDCPSITPEEVREILKQYKKESEDEAGEV